MMNILSLLYLAVFPVVTVALGLYMLSQSMLASDDKLALRKVQRWRFIAAFSLFAVAWLLLVSLGMLVFSNLQALLHRDMFGALALVAGMVWVGCTGYWLALMYSADNVLHLPEATARRTASTTLLWNLILTIPFFAFAMPAHAEPLRILAGM